MPGEARPVIFNSQICHRGRRRGTTYYAGDL